MILHIQHYPASTFIWIVYICLENTLAVLVLPYLLLRLLVGWLFDTDPDNLLGGQAKSLLFQSVMSLVPF